MKIRKVYSNDKESISTRIGNITTYYNIVRPNDYRRYCLLRSVYMWRSVDLWTMKRHDVIPL